VVQTLNFKLETHTKQSKEAKISISKKKKYFDKLKKKTPKNLDYVMQDLHDAEFKKTDCLKCANCCKTTGHYLRMQILSVFQNILDKTTTVY
jgi:uncharacterized protein YcbK (DUF882 family)